MVKNLFEKTQGSWRIIKPRRMMRFQLNFSIYIMIIILIFKLIGDLKLKFDFVYRKKKE